jgi:hypothetical protein
VIWAMEGPDIVAADVIDLSNGPVFVPRSRGRIVAFRAA